MLLGISFLTIEQKLLAVIYYFVCGHLFSRSVSRYGSFIVVYTHVIVNDV